MAYQETTAGANFSANQAVTGTTDSTNTFDVTGAGVGTLPAMIGPGGVNTALGVDIGAGNGAAQAQILLTVVGSTTVTGTLTVTLSAAPDNGSGSTGSYTELFQTVGLTGASQLGLNKQYIFYVPPILPGEAIPRFYKMTYTVTGSISVVLDANLLINAPTIRNVTLLGNNIVAL